MMASELSLQATTVNGETVKLQITPRPSNIKPLAAAFDDLIWRLGDSRLTQESSNG